MDKKASPPRRHVKRSFKTNRLILISAAILAISLFWQPLDVPAQDANDPGEPDTVYLTAGGIHSRTGDTLYVRPDSFPQDVTVCVNAWNDNSVTAFTVVLIDSCNGSPCNTALDPSKNNGDGPSKCFEGSRVEYLDGQGFISSMFPPKFFLWGLAMYVEPVPPGDGLLATVIFTVSDTGRICLDTAFVPPSNVLAFVDPKVVRYAPVFEKKAFVVSECAYSSGDLNYDGLIDIADVDYLVSYMFRRGQAPCVLKSGDANCDGSVNISDIVFLIHHVLRGGPPPGYCP